MNRLELELTRLYATQADAGGVGALVLEVADPAEWQPLAAVFQGLQADLDLPAPAIAVNGRDAMQLWFSLAQPLPAADAVAFLELLRLRYMGHINRHRVRLLAGAVEPVPALQAGTGMWSAFVAPDLASVMADEPWLDLPPNPDGQAALLARLQSIAPAALQRAMAQLQPAAAPGGAAASAQPARGPREFLMDVMNDPAIALALRIEAAKALLPPPMGHPPDA